MESPGEHPGMSTKPAPKGNRERATAAHKWFFMASQRPDARSGAPSRTAQIGVQTPQRTTAGTACQFARFPHHLVERPIKLVPTATSGRVPKEVKSAASGGRPGRIFPSKMPAYSLARAVFHEADRDASIALSAKPAGDGRGKAQTAALVSGPDGCLSGWAACDKDRAPAAR